MTRQITAVFKFRSVKGTRTGEKPHGCTVCGSFPPENLPSGAVSKVAAQSRFNPDVMGSNRTLGGQKVPGLVAQAC